jgi:carbon-monoxide dehydrogenase medium subunit
MLKEIFVPFPTDSMRMIYLKHGPRRTMDCAIVGVAVVLGLNHSCQFCNSAKIVLGAVAPTPVRAKNTERLIVGKAINKFVKEDIKTTVKKEIAPISDVRASAEYRAEMTSVLTVRAIESLVNLK